MFPAVLTTLLFSFSAVCASRSTRLLGPITANFWRLVLATIYLAVWAHLFGGGWSGPALGLFVWSGVVGFGFGDVAFFLALPSLGPRLTILIVQCLAAPLAALIEWLWLGTTLRPAQIGCGITILTGVAIALAPAEHLDVSRRSFRKAIAWAVVGAMGQALGAVMSRKAFAISQSAGVNVDGFTSAYQRIVGGLLIAAIAYLGLKYKEKSRRTASPEMWLWLVLNSLAGPSLGVSCYQWALKSAPSGVVLPIVATTPLVVMPFSRWLEGERVTRRSLAGGVLAVAGAAGLAWSL